MVDTAVQSGGKIGPLGKLYKINVSVEISYSFGECVSTKWAQIPFSIIVPGMVQTDNRKFERMTVYGG